MRLLFGAGRRGRNPLLRYPGRQCRGQGGDYARRPTGLVCRAEGLAAGASAASAAASLHRGTGATVRLLLQRHADQGLGTSLEQSEAHPGRDPQPYEWASLPLRHLSAGDEGDPACVHQNGGSNAMTDILSDTNFSRRDLLKGGGALIVGFSMTGAL